jgi:hypothetical protein
VVSIISSLYSILIYWFEIWISIMETLIVSTKYPYN